MAVKLERTETITEVKTWDYTLGASALEDINRRLAWAYSGSGEPLQATEDDVKAIWMGEHFSLKDGSAWLQEEYKDKDGQLISGWLFVLSELMLCIKAFSPRSAAGSLIKYAHNVK